CDSQRNSIANPGLARPTPTHKAVGSRYASWVPDSTTRRGDLLHTWCLCAVWAPHCIPTDAVGLGVDLPVRTSHSAGCRFASGKCQRGPRAMACGVCLRTTCPGI